MQNGQPFLFYRKLRRNVTQKRRGSFEDVIRDGEKYVFLII